MHSLYPTDKTNKPIENYKPCNEKCGLYYLQSFEVSQVSILRGQPTPKLIGIEVPEVIQDHSITIKQKVSSAQLTLPKLIEDSPKS